jgi:hypothetical protein
MVDQEFRAKISSKHRRMFVWPPPSHHASAHNTFVVIMRLPHAKCLTNSAC